MAASSMCWNAHLCIFSKFLSAVSGIMTVVEKLVDNICDNLELWKLKLLIFGIGEEDYAPLFRWEVLKGFSVGHGRRCCLNGI